MSNPKRTREEIRDAIKKTKMSKEQTPMTAEILKITNESPYGWLHLDSVEAEKISKLIDDSIKAKVLEALESTSMEEAYKAGQESMYCGCYEKDSCTSFTEWINTKQK